MPNPHAAAGHDVVLAEMMARRTLVINVMSAQAHRESMAREKIADLIRYADKERFRRANDELGTASTSVVRPCDRDKAMNLQPII